MKLEPVLGENHSLEAALQTADLPFNSFRILRAFAREAAATTNARFYKSERSLKELKYKAAPEGGWQVRDGRVTHYGRVLVCAVGAMMPDFLEAAFGLKMNMRRLRALVAVFHQQLCRRMLINIDRRSRFLNFVPFEAGTTANIGAADVEMQSEIDDKFDPRDIRAFARVVEAHLPGIMRWPPCSVLFHTCQKLEYRGAHAKEGGARHYFYEEGDDAMYYLYPGKFTLAPVAAERLAKDLADKYGKGSGSENVRTIETPEVDLAARPYLRPVTHMTAVRERFVFDELEG